jgi:hypothetical protein
MIVRRLHNVGELLAVLEEPFPKMRLAGQLGCLGRHLVVLLRP